MTVCISTCCREHPNRRCYLPAGHLGDHTDGLGHAWLNRQALQLNNGNELKQETQK